MSSSLGSDCSSLWVKAKVDMAKCERWAVSADMRSERVGRERQLNEAEGWAAALLAASGPVRKGSDERAWQQQWQGLGVAREMNS